MVEPKLNLEKLSEHLGKLLAYFRVYNKKIDKLVSQFDIYDLISYVNGHEATSPELKTATDLLLEEYEQDQVRESLEYIKNHERA